MRLKKSLEIKFERKWDQGRWNGEWSWNWRRKGFEGMSARNRWI